MTSRHGNLHGGSRRLRVRVEKHPAMLIALCAGLVTGANGVDAADDIHTGPTPVRPNRIVLRAEAQRIEMVDRVGPSVVCIHDDHRRGGGSGVLIDSEGYGLTNYHVVQGLMGKRRGWGGLGDGVLYELEVLGIDVTGDVAMFRLIPSQPGNKFPWAPLGDSDKVRVGDTAIAMGNPFMLSEDSTPSVSIGMVTGVHRYQRGVGGNLVYTDCIQIDAPINPGNSGGPLFNAAGEVIGINGRISVNTRGRFNVGFGYAVSSNQIRRFIPALRAGLLARHGTWQARVEDRGTPGGDPVVAFAEVRAPGPAHAAGVRVDDRLLALDGVPVASANQVASMLGTYPTGWPLALRIESAGNAERTVRDLIVRLDPLHPRLRSPFEPDQNVAAREIKHILRAFRQAVLGDARTSPPARWKCKLVRRYLQGADSDEADAVAPQHFGVLYESNEPIRMLRLPTDSEDRGTWRLIEYDDRNARAWIDQEEPHTLTVDESMVLRALYVMQRRLVDPAEDADLSSVAHGGCGVRLHPPAGAGTTAPPVLTVIEWPVGDSARARLGFDTDSSLLVQIGVHDPRSGSEATITLSDYRDIGGLVWPCTMEVRGDGYHYRDTLTDWEMSP